MVAVITLKMLEEKTGDKNLPELFKHHFGDAWLVTTISAGNVADIFPWGSFAYLCLGRAAKEEYIEHFLAAEAEYRGERISRDIFYRNCAVAFAKAFIKQNGATT